MTTREDARKYFDWLEQETPITIEPLDLLELAERAQARAQAVKDASQEAVNRGTAIGIIADMEQSALGHDYDSTMDDQGDKMLGLCLIAVLFVLCIGGIWAVVHFAASIDRWHL